MDSQDAARIEIDDENCASFVELLCSAAHLDFRRAWYAIDAWMSENGAEFEDLDEQAQAFVRARDDDDLDIASITALMERFNIDGESILVSGHGSAFLRSPGIGGALIALVMCSDFFAWACADAEQITPSMYREIIETADTCSHLEDVTTYAPLLVVARKRGMRPITPRLERMPKPWRAMFEAIDVGTSH